jgi:hypothetical protein
MADRTRATNGTVSRSRDAAAAAAGAGPTTGPVGVRRNLFQSQLTRRPTASSSNSSETLRLDVDVLGEPAGPLSTPPSSEIVVRDQHGEIELGDPPTPILEDPDEVPADERQETERERQRLADAVRHHQNSHPAVSDRPEGR